MEGFCNTVNLILNIVYFLFCLIFGKSLSNLFLDPSLPLSFPLLVCCDTSWAALSSTFPFIALLFFQNKIFQIINQLGLLRPVIYPTLHILRSRGFLNTVTLISYTVNI